MIHLFRKKTLGCTEGNNFLVSSIDIPKEDEYDFLMDDNENIAGIKQEFAEDTKYKCHGPVFVVYSK